MKAEALSDRPLSRPLCLEVPRWSSFDKQHGARNDLIKSHHVRLRCSAALIDAPARARHSVMTQVLVVSQAFHWTFLAVSHLEGLQPLPKPAQDVSFIDTRA